MMTLLLQELTMTGLTTSDTGRFQAHICSIA